MHINIYLYRPVHSRERGKKEGLVINMWILDTEMIQNTVVVTNGVKCVAKYLNVEMQYCRSPTKQVQRHFITSFKPYRVGLPMEKMGINMNKQQNTVIGCMNFPTIKIELI